MESKNLQYAFEVEYYQDLPNLLKAMEKYKECHKNKCCHTKTESPDVIYYKSRNSAILKLANSLSEKMENLDEYNIYRDKENRLSTWEFRSTYPGVLIGIGQNHNVSGKGEIGMGFTFDYVTGMPYLPGSSLKGLLRYGFKQTEYIQTLIKGITNKTLSEEEIVEFEKTIFGGMTQDKRAVFYDVIISNPEEKDLLALDVITPHSKNGLKEPNPITFLRICPGIKFHFQLQLYDVILSDGNKFSKCEIEEIFKNILEDLGIGAKTNVGYGVLVK